MRLLWLAPLVLVLPVAWATGCSDTSYISCTTSADCLQGSIPGTCVLSPVSDTQWCGFPDDSCLGRHLRWGVKSGDGLASECVPASETDGGPDAAAADAAPVGACDLNKPFAPAIEVPGIHQPGANDVHATLTDDELTIYFASDRANPTAGKMHIYSAGRTTAQGVFDTPAKIGTLSSDAGESNPSTSPDGNTLYFDSPRVSQGAVHIFTSTRANATVVFPPPTMIAGDYLTGPSITADGAVLYAANLSSGALVRLDKEGDGFGTPQLVAFPTPLGAVSPVSRDDLTLFLSQGDTYGNSILVTRRTSTGTPFPQPTAIPELATSAAIAEPSWISPDGCRLYLRYSATGDKSRIYVATRPQ
jgi:hypothetical protein